MAASTCTTQVSLDCNTTRLLVGLNVTRVCAGGAIQYTTYLSENARVSVDVVEVLPHSQL